MTTTGGAGVLQIVLGGVVGSSLTYCLTWYRERRRMSDAVRAPQREAIAGIAAAAHELFVQELRFAQLTRDRANALEGKPLQFSSRQSFDGLTVDLNRAIFALTMAMQLGQLTVIDQPCVSAANAVQEAFNNVKRVLPAASKEKPDAEAHRKFAGEIESSIDNLQESVRHLVAVGRSRVSPTQAWWRRLPRDMRRQQIAPAPQFDGRGDPGEQFGPPQESGGGPNTR